MLEKASLDSDLVSGPVEYSSLRAGAGPSTNLPIVLWLHGGGGSARFLETCQAQFVSCWTERSLPDLVAVTPSCGWSLYLDRRDGSELWETFILQEFVPHIRRQTGSVSGPLVVGGISVGATAALRLAFKRPDLVSAVAAIEPTIEAAATAERVPLRDRVQLPAAVRARHFGDPIDPEYWLENHPPSLIEKNGPAIAANGTAIYFDAGEQDLLHAQHGSELLHRTLFDAGLSHEYRFVRGGNHVGPTVGPRIVDALRFVGAILKPAPMGEQSVASVVELDTFAAQVKDLETAAGYRRTRTVQGPDCELTVHVQGEGHPVVLIPSLGRGAGDFAELADRLANNGYQAVRPEPRGINGSSRALSGLTLEDFADDVAATIELIEAPATIVGHDFGGLVAQMVAYHYPDLVSSLVLLASPGPIEPKPEPATALRRVFIPELTAEEHLEAIALALFADGNDPVVWVDGWHSALAFAQAEAERQIPVEELWSNLRVKALAVQPEADLMVLPDNADLMAAQVGELVTLVSIPNAGHALLPEQPEAVASAVLSWLKTHS